MIGKFNIALDTGICLPVVGIIVNKYFGVYRRLAGFDKLCILTHLPTGREIAKFYTLTPAKDVAERLAALPVDWTKQRSPYKCPKKIMAKVIDIVNLGQVLSLIEMETINENRKGCYL